MPRASTPDHDLWQPLPLLGPSSPICKTGRCGFARDHSSFPQDLLGSAVMRVWLPGRGCPTQPLYCPPSTPRSHP